MGERLYYHLCLAHHRLTRFADRACLDALGVTSVQLGALFLIGSQPGCRQTDVAAALDLNGSAVTGLVRRMEKAELIERTRCPDDGRAVRLRLTRRGRSRLDKGRPLLAEFNQRLCADFSAEERAVIARFLRTTADRFGPGEEGDDA